MSRRRSITESIAEFERAKTTTAQAATAPSAAAAAPSGSGGNGVGKRRKNLANSLLVRAGAELQLDGRRAVRLVHSCLRRHIRQEIHRLLATYYESFVQPCLSHCDAAATQQQQQQSSQQHHRVNFYRSVAEDLVRQFSADSDEQQQQQQQSLPEVRSGNSPFSAYRQFADGAAGDSPPCAVSPDSSFVVGSCVNRCLGLVSRGCQRVYDRHRYLFRYLCDTEDKRHLIDRSHLNSSSGSRTYLLLLDEVLELLSLPEYRSVSQRAVDRLKASAFQLPAWLARKVAPNHHQHHHQMQPQQQQRTSATATAASTAATSPAGSSLVGGTSEPVSPYSVSAQSSP